MGFIAENNITEVYFFSEKYHYLNETRNIFRASHFCTSCSLVLDEPAEEEERFCLSVIGETEVDFSAVTHFFQQRSRRR